MIENKSLELCQVELPIFNGKIGDQLYMIPFNCNDLSKIPDKWVNWLKSILNLFPKMIGNSFLTVDQKFVPGTGKKHRRGQPHMDGNYLNQNDWGGGSGWLNGVSGLKMSEPDRWQSYHVEGLGTFLATNYAACKVWTGNIDGEPGAGGNCSHLSDKLALNKSYIMKPNKLHWIGSRTIHESLSIHEPVKRTLVRITLPLE